MDIHHTKWLVFFTLTLLLLTGLVWIADLDLQSIPTPVPDKDTVVVTPLLPKNSDADDAYAEFLKWKAENKPVPIETDDYLRKPEKIFSSDYRFTLERAIALAAGYGHKEKENLEHKSSYDFLKRATEKAIIGGKSEEMLKRLISEKKMDKYRREQGVSTWWNFDSHAKHWNPIAKALARNDIKKLLKYPDGHTHAR